MDAIAILAYAAFRAADPHPANPDTATGDTPVGSAAEAGTVAVAGSGRGDEQLRSGSRLGYRDPEHARANMRSRTLFYKIAPRPLRSNRQYIWRGRGPGRSTRREPSGCYRRRQPLSRRNQFRVRLIVGRPRRVQRPQRGGWNCGHDFIL